MANWRRWSEGLYSVPVQCDDSPAHLAQQWVRCGIRGRPNQHDGLRSQGWTLLKGVADRLHGSEEQGDSLFLQGCSVIMSQPISNSTEVLDGDQLNM